MLAIISLVEFDFSYIDTHELKISPLRIILGTVTNTALQKQDKKNVAPLTGLVSTARFSSILRQC